MKITARVGYAGLALLELGQSPDKIQAREIAERQEIPLKFLEQILTQLKAAGLVTSIRGAAGGYMLARDPEQISLLDIVHAVEGELQLVDSSVMDSSMFSIWTEIEEDFLARLAAVSIQDVIDRKLREDGIINFDI
jgi:Rrf2 family cysteine metabolism transcriptional repressor